MSYTVSELADLSGVSIRTLRWYDQVGLLKPAYYGSNGYRYYEEEQLYLLQQILFFRELGFQLREIQKILVSNHFDKINALLTHRDILKRDVQRTTTLLETIDKTIAHLKGDISMKEQDLYKGFDEKKQKKYEQYLVKYHGTIAEDLIHESKKRTSAWDKADWSQVEKEGNEIYKELSQCIESGQQPKESEAQNLIQRHFEMTKRFYTVSKDVYMGLAQLYVEHPDFRTYFERFHAQLAEFIAEAMRVYAMKHLS